MAVLSKCAELKVGQDSSCIALQRKFFQQAVVINKLDIENYAITKAQIQVPNATT